HGGAAGVAGFGATGFGAAAGGCWVCCAKQNPAMQITSTAMESTPFIDENLQTITSMEQETYPNPHQNANMREKNHRGTEEQRPERVILTLIGLCDSMVFPMRRASSSDFSRYTINSTMRNSDVATEVATTSPSINVRGTGLPGGDAYRF